MTSPVHYEQSADIAHVHMDDGRLNIMTHEMLEALHLAFERAETKPRVVVLRGRNEIFTAGFDLKVLRGDDVVQHCQLLRLGAELALRVLRFPKPVVAVCSGNVFPMGAFLLLAADVRVGADGSYGIGLNEVAIGMTVPQFAIELARQRLTPAYFNRSLTTGERFVPEEARQAGYLDAVVPPEQLHAKVHEIATNLSTIDQAAHAATKAKARQQGVQALRAAIDDELTTQQLAAAMRNRQEG